MCDPVSLAAGAVSIGSTVYSGVQQNKADKQNKKAAKAALHIQNRDISMRALQERISAAQEAQQLTRDAAEASSLTAVSAAGGNVGGMTVDMLLRDVENQKLEGLDRIEQQSAYTQEQLMLERSGALATSRNRANQTQPANPFAMGLRIAGAGLDAYTAYRAQRPKITPGGN